MCQLKLTIAKLASNRLQQPSTVITVQRELSGAAAMQLLLSASRTTLRETSAHLLEPSKVKLHIHIAKEQLEQLDVESIILNLLLTANGRRYQLRIFQLSI